MAIDFPNSPAENEQYTVGDRTWTWNGTYWEMSTSTSTFTAGDSEPVDADPGDIWFDSTIGKTFVNYSGTWVEIGNAATVVDVIADADADTKVQVEVTADSDKIEFTTAGTKRLEIDASGHVIPAANETYDLGSASNRFRDLYLSGSSIDLGGVSITSDGSNISLPNVDDIAASSMTVAGENVTPYTGRRNLLYNGAMQVAQRGTSSTGTTSAYRSLDRWKYQNNSAGSFTVTQDTDAPDGFSNSYKATCGTADATPVYLQVWQGLEGQDLQHLMKGTSSAKSLTVSFWVKSNVAGTFIVELEDSVNSRGISKSYSVSSSDTWEYKTLTFEGDTTGSFDNDNNLSLRLNYWLSASSTYTSGTLQTTWGDTATSANRAVGLTGISDTVNNYWQITGVQLEVGDKATPFEHRSFGEELALCKRYFETSYAYGVSFGTNQSSFPTVVQQVPFYAALGQTDGWGGMRTVYTVTKRSTPSVAVYRPDGTLGSIQIVYGSTPSSTFVSPTVYGNQNGHMINTSNFATGSLIKVLYHYTASAEL